MIHENVIFYGKHTKSSIAIHLYIYRTIGTAECFGYVVGVSLCDIMATDNNFGPPKLIYLAPLIACFGKRTKRVALDSIYLPGGGCLRLLLLAPPHTLIQPYTHLIRSDGALK